MAVCELHNVDRRSLFDDPKIIRKSLAAYVSLSLFDFQTATLPDGSSFY
jgi:hypothetical protein